MASLHLLNWLQEVREPPGDLASGLTAILRHNLPEQEIDIGREPLTLLLMLCDHLQEWGRPRVGTSPLSRGVMESLRFSEQPRFEKKISMHEVVVNGLRMKEPRARPSIERVCDGCVKSDCEGDQECRVCFRVNTELDQSSGLEFRLRHVESIKGDFEPGVSWLLLCRDMQGLGFEKDKLPFNITITLEHATPRIWRVLPMQLLELDILEEYANTNETASYLCDWIESARLGREGVHHEADEENGEEIFTLKLHELGRPLKRGLWDSHWRPYVKWKWKWLAQRFVNLRIGAWFPEL